MDPYYSREDVALYLGDWVDVLRSLPAASVQCVVTSPPYWGLRDYGVPGQLGNEDTPEEYVAKLVAGFQEVRRVLKPDGVVWLNLGDTYAMSTKGSSGRGDKQVTNKGTLLEDRSWRIPAGLKPKDLVGIPWRAALALQADGWWLRSDVIWAKPNPMPESVTDRPTKAHEYVFLLTASESYFYDADAIREPMSHGSRSSHFTNGKTHAAASARRPVGKGERRDNPLGRNKRSVWPIATQPYSGAHFATMPPALARTCVLAGSRPGDTVLDPFNGASTTGMVALQEGRRYVGCDINPDYLAQSVRRLSERAAQRVLLAAGGDA